MVTAAVTVTTLDGGGGCSVGEEASGRVVVAVHSTRQLKCRAQLKFSFWCVFAVGREEQMCWNATALSRSV